MTTKEIIFALPVASGYAYDLSSVQSLLPFAKSLKCYAGGKLIYAYTDSKGSEISKRLSRKKQTGRDRKNKIK